MVGEKSPAYLFQFPKWMLQKTCFPMVSMHCQIDEHASKASSL